MRDETLTLGIDVGTQGIRVAAVDADGGVVASDSAPLTSHIDGVRHEQDPRDWWTGLVAACRGVAGALASDGERLTDLAIDSTSGTVLLCRPDGTPLGQALMYNDARAVDDAAAIGRVDEAPWRELGVGMGATSGLAKARWLWERRPDDDVVIVHSADWLAWQLVGAPVATDWSHALKTGGDPRTASWPHEALEALGLPVTALPAIVRPGVQLGELSAAAAERTGLPAGCRVRAGMTDGCAAQLAAGAIAPGRWTTTLGTTLVLKGVTTTLLDDPTGVVYSHRHPDGHWLPGGASNVGAGALRDRFPGADLTELDAAAAKHGPATAVTYPIVGQGERFPFRRDDATAFTDGAPSDEVDAYRAVLEGVAITERIALARLTLLGAEVDGAVTTTGGGARSDVWSQLRADILHRPVEVVSGADAAVGMALLARAGDGSVTDAMAATSRSVRRFEPAPTPALDANVARLTDALHARGWLDATTAAEATP